MLFNKGLGLDMPTTHMECGVLKVAIPDGMEVSFKDGVCCDSNLVWEVS